MQTRNCVNGDLCRCCEKRFIPTNGFGGEHHCSLQCAFWSGVKYEDIKPNGCWPWQKRVHKQRGVLKFRGVRYEAHRASYVLHHDNEVKRLLNTCGTKHCVNPNHWEPG